MYCSLAAAQSAVRALLHAASWTAPCVGQVAQQTTLHLHLSKQHTRPAPLALQVLIGSPDLKANHRITQIFDFPAEHEKYPKLVRILEKVRARPVPQ